MLTLATSVGEPNAEAVSGLVETKIRSDPLTTWVWKSVNPSAEMTGDPLFSELAEFTLANGLSEGVLKVLNRSGRTALKMRKSLDSLRDCKNMVNPSDESDQA
jgi:hypothetical protein